MDVEFSELATESTDDAARSTGLQGNLSGLEPEAQSGADSVPARIQTPVTQSSLGTLNSCEELYRLKYVLGLLPATEDLALSLGSAYHRGLELGSADAAVELFKNSTTYWTQADRDNLSINSAIVEAMVGGALRLWGNDLPDQREVQFTLPLINPETGRASTRHVFRGVIDGIWTSPVRGAEYKTAGRVDKAYIDRLQLDFQVGAMLTAIGRLLDLPPWKIPMSYRIAKKPQSRQRKNESVSEFAARIKADYIERPEFYFHDLVLRRSEDQMKRWQHEAWRLHQRILYIENGGFTVRNTRHCTQFRRCAFLDLCCGSVGIDVYRTKDSIHPELENNNG